MPEFARRRFPPPWSAEETEACDIVRDANGHALAYVYFEDEPGRRSAAHLMTRYEARRIALKICKLPQLLTSPWRSCSQAHCGDSHDHAHANHLPQLRA